MKKYEQKNWVTTREACRLTGLLNWQLWHMAAQGRLSPPKMLSPRRALWRRDQIELLAANT